MPKRNKTIFNFTYSHDSGTINAILYQRPIYGGRYLGAKALAVSHIEFFFYYKLLIVISYHAELIVLIVDYRSRQLLPQ